MSNETNFNEIAKFLVTSLISDADLRNKVKNEIYPLQMELGKKNITFAYELIYKLIFEMDYTVWFTVSEEVVEKYSMGTNRVKLSSTNCKGFGLGDDGNHLIADISINGQPTLLEFHVSSMMTGLVEANGTDKAISIESILPVVVNSFLMELASNKDNKETIKLEDVMKSDNVVKVDFGRKH